MANGAVLELASLAERHPDLDFPYPHCMMAVIRLSLDPMPAVALPPEAVKRAVVVNHRPPGSRKAKEFEQEIGWTGLGFTDAIRVRLTNHYNDHVLTEYAAIAVMGLLVHELEGVQIKKVLQIGAGGDYTAEVLKSGEVLQVEGSGITRDYPSKSWEVLDKKCAQLVGQGYASVTTFYQMHKEGGIVHTFLHYVKIEQAPQGGVQRPAAEETPMIFTSSTSFDPKGQASRWSMQGEKARMFGNMREASELHAKAGAELEADVANKIKKSDKDVIRFLAATQYYLGGHYVKAEEICRKIQANTLPERERSLYPKFLTAVHERAKQDYALKMRDRLKQLWLRHEYQETIDLLKEHRYVLDEVRLAYIRGYCCERLEDYQSAASFFSDVLRKSPNNAVFGLLCAAAPVYLVTPDTLDKAWDYAQQLLTGFTHPLTYLTASIVRFNQAGPTKETAEKQRLHEEQLQLFQEAVNRFQQLPAMVQSDPEYRELMILGFAEATIAHRNIGQISEATAVLERAIVFAPNDPFLQQLRGSLKDPQTQPSEDVQQVIELEKQIVQKFARRDSDFPQVAA